MINTLLNDMRTLTNAARHTTRCWQQVGCSDCCNCKCAKQARTNARTMTGDFPSALSATEGECTRGANRVCRGEAPAPAESARGLPMSALLLLFCNISD